MFQNNGMPTGYDQIAPGRDLPKQTPPGQPGRPPSTPLQQAIAPSQYPADPSMQQWRQSAGQKRPISSVNPPAPPQATGQIAPSGSSFNNFGGGWDNADPIAQALHSGLSNGQSGQALADSINQRFHLQPGSSLAYYANNGDYAMPGWYAAPNAQNNGALDLVKRSGGGGISPLHQAVLGSSAPIGNTYLSLLGLLNQGQGPRLY